MMAPHMTEASMNSHMQRGQSPAGIGTRRTSFSAVGSKLVGLHAQVEGGVGGGGVARVVVHQARQQLQHQAGRLQLDLPGRPPAHACARTA